MNTSYKKRIAVFFGGISPEHDVSVITGLQALNALDSTKYEAFAVYIDIEGNWWIGEPLKNRNNYLPTATIKKHLTPVTLGLAPSTCGTLYPTKNKLFAKQKPINFDVALLAFHGNIGEDGAIQGLFETANIPYTGMRAAACNILMDKALTKQMLAHSDIPQLPYTIIDKPTEGLLLNDKELTNICKNITFPCCVKPVHLGSSIGVAKATTTEELNAVLPNIFKYDTQAIVEPFVENLVEYNIAIKKTSASETITSAIEQPKCSQDLLDFKQKYTCGSKTKIGTKSNTSISEGMLSLTRELNPKLAKALLTKIQKYSICAFNLVNGTGAPRIDFMMNAKTKKLWLNEINPCPGSFGYFLWEATKDNTLFTELLSQLINEALALKAKKPNFNDPVPKEARLLKH